MQAILGYEFRDDGKPHDCLLDAMIPMRIVCHTLKYGIKGPIDIEEKMVQILHVNSLLIVHFYPRLGFISEACALDTA